MSKARPIYPGAVLFSTRRTHKRQLLLRPSAKVNEVILYIFAVLAERHRIRPHALCVMSNHKHDVSTDDFGRVVEFDRDCHALIARVLNSLHGDFESLWSREAACRVTCVAADDVIDKIAYTMANPVAAHLVEHGKSWPGLRLAWPMRPRTVRRPAFFRTEEFGGSWPEEATLDLHRPPGYDHLNDDELGELVRNRIERLEQAARDGARRANRRFLGRRAILRQSRYAYPSACEKRFTLRPSIACKSKWARIARLQGDEAWLSRYRDALARLRAGETGVRFPCGTWKMRVYYSVDCDPLPAQLSSAGELRATLIGA
jgi:putative transposase